MMVGKYELKRTIGEGMFAKVKLGVEVENNAAVAVKVIDKKTVIENNLMYQVINYFSLSFLYFFRKENKRIEFVREENQVKREISTMKLLDHPNIVKIREVIATKTKIYLVMEYVAGGQLSDKLNYLEKIDEKEARKYFHQLIDAVDYCHSRGVYHRDLKPENLLLDSKGNLKLSDFGLSALKRPGDLLATACGSPSYVAPEVITHKNYDGAAADIWSCGVVLFELLAGFLPFQDRSLTNLYRKIAIGDYIFPIWFTQAQKKLISKILEPLPTNRARVSDILEEEWFKVEYRQNVGQDCDENLSQSYSDETQNHGENNSWRFINAFQLIAMSNDLDLSGLFQEEKIKFGSEHPVDETFARIEVAAKDVDLSVKRINNSRVRLHVSKGLSRSRSHYSLSAEVVEVTPKYCVVEVSKSTGDLGAYSEFCKSLSSLLKHNCRSSPGEAESSKEGENEDVEFIIKYN